MIVRRTALALALATSSCGFFGDGGFCNDWCGFFVCVLDDECGGEEPEAVCQKSCSAAEDSLSEREQTLVKECMSCVNELMNGGCDRSAVDRIDPECDRACEGNATEAALEEFFGSFEDELAVECR